MSALTQPVVDDARMKKTKNFYSLRKMKEIKHFSDIYFKPHTYNTKNRMDSYYKFLVLSLTPEQTVEKTGYPYPTPPSSLFFS